MASEKGLKGEGMQKLLKVAVALSLTIGVLLVIASGGNVRDIYVSGTWRYKMTVVVDTPEGEKSGFAVREVRVWNSSLIPKLPDASTATVKVKGEAVVVDLDERGKLFGIMKSHQYGENYTESILYAAMGGGTSADGIRALNRAKKNRPVTLSMQDWPTFVTFTDMTDPKSVTPVLKMERARKNGTGDWIVTEDRTEELFGEGVKIKDVIIEMTDEPVTWGIERDLSWLPLYFNKMFDGQRYNTMHTDYPYANSLASGNFSTGNAQ